MTSATASVMYLYGHAHDNLPERCVCNAYAWHNFARDFDFINPAVWYTFSSMAVQR